MRRTHSKDLYAFWKNINDIEKQIARLRKEIQNGDRTKETGQRGEERA